MAGKGSEGNTWGEQWEFNTINEPPKQQQHSKEEKKLSRKLGESFNKTKEGASKSMKKVKDGASVGLFWIKDKCTKKSPN